MQRLILAAFIALAAPASAFAQGVDTPPLALGYHVSTSAIVVTQPIRVLDADTFDVGVERFRINNLDAPETFRPDCQAEQTMGERATAEARRILSSASRIVLYPERRRDRSARVLARVEVDGQDFAGLLIAEGIARPWRGRTADWCAILAGTAR